MTQVTTTPARQHVPTITVAAVTLRALEDLQTTGALSDEQLALTLVCKEKLGLPVSHRTYSRNVLHLVEILKGEQ